MSTILFKRGTTSQLDQYTGKEGELVIDNENKTLRVFDGTNKGGYLIGGLDVIDGGIIPEPEDPFVKRSDYNIYIVSVRDNVKFDPIMIWLRVNPNDSSKIQYWDETRDDDWDDYIRAKYPAYIQSTVTESLDVENVINQTISTYAASTLKDSVDYTMNKDEKVFLGYQDLGWNNIHKVSCAVPTYVYFNNVLLSLPSAEVSKASSASNEIAFYQNVFEKDWIPS